MSDLGMDFENAMNMMACSPATGYDFNGEWHPFVCHKNTYELSDDAKDFMNSLSNIEPARIIDSVFGSGKCKEIFSEYLYKKTGRGRRVDTITKASVVKMFHKFLFSFLKAGGLHFYLPDDLDLQKCEQVRRSLSEYFFRDGIDYIYNREGQSVMDSVIVRRKYLVKRFKECAERYQKHMDDYVDHGFADFLLYGPTISEDPHCRFKQYTEIEGFDVSSIDTKEDLYAQLCSGAAPSLGISFVVRIWAMNVSMDELINTAIEALNGPVTICGRTYESEAQRYCFLKNIIRVYHLSINGFTEDDVEAILGRDYRILCKPSPAPSIPPRYPVKGYKILMCALRDNYVKEKVIEFVKDGCVYEPYYPDNPLGCFLKIRDKYSGAMKLIKPKGVKSQYRELDNGYVSRILDESLGRVEGSKEPILMRDAEHYRLLLKILSPEVAYAINGAYFYLRHLAIEQGMTTQEELIKVADKFYEGLGEGPYGWCEYIQRFILAIANGEFRF